MEFVLKGIFDYAVSNGWIGENPVDRVTVPKIASDDDDMVFLSVREVELLADEAEKIGKPVDGLLVRWQAYTGCRIGESLALKVGDVDAAKRRARIGRTWTDDGHGGSMLGTRRTERPATSRYHGSSCRRSRRRWMAWVMTTGCSVPPVAGTSGRTRGGQGYGTRPSSGRHGGRGRDHTQSAPHIRELAIAQGADARPPDAAAATPLPASH